jgi:hypothetical protein
MFVKKDYFHSAAEQEGINQNDRFFDPKGRGSAPRVETNSVDSVYV